MGGRREVEGNQLRTDGDGASKGHPRAHPEMQCPPRTLGPAVDEGFRVRQPLHHLHRAVPPRRRGEARHVEIGPVNEHVGAAGSIVYVHRENAWVIDQLVERVEAQ
eukprot:GHVU01072590.1.p3 GENE.GHVU01072590.1~~GHVU01072590.1.p3  ORF type:complete len:106 (-),score=13.97 GHVU01072590.1:144-461(-)